MKYNNMKLKSTVLAGSLVVIFFLLAGITTVKADGIFSDKKNTESTEPINETQTESGGGIFARAPGDGWGDEGGENPQPGEEESPIGEGLLILSLLSGTYAIVKRNVKRKHED